MLLAVPLRIGSILSLGGGPFVQPFQDSCRLARASMSIGLYSEVHVILCQTSLKLAFSRQISERYSDIVRDRGSTRCCATNRKVAGSIPAGVNRFFIDIIFFRSHYGPGVDSASNRNEYREYFLGVKSGRGLKLTTLPPSCAVVTKSGSLNFLRTLWACPGL